MREVLYHRHAARYLKRMPADRKEQVKASVADLAAFAEVLAHPNVRPMKGDWEGCFRLRVGRYRAIFKLTATETAQLLEVLIVGPRGDMY